jgi:hypothetical protein
VISLGRKNSQREKWDLGPEARVEDAEYRRLLGYPRHYEPEGRSLELMAWARAWYAENGRPWIYRREAEVSLAAGALRLDGVGFDCAELSAHFGKAQVERAVLIAASAGAAAEGQAQILWQEGKPDEYFFLQAYAAAVVERLVAETSARICAGAERDGLIAVPHYSPGYAGWDVAEQNKLFQLIAAGMAGEWPEPIEVLSSGMIRPTKSLLGVFGLTARNPQSLASVRLVPCRSCSFSPCQFRRAPYRHGPPSPLPS